MQLGVQIEVQEGLTWERWRHIASLTEALGYESLWCSDHFFALLDRPERNALETWAALVDLASHSNRLRFGPLVCAMTFRQPALLARMAAAVDDLSGGRLVLGVGAAWNVREHEVFGIPFPPVRERMDRLEEGIRVIKALWSGERVSLQGKYYALDEAELHPLPAQKPHPPLLVGGSGEQRTLRIVANYADEWNTSAMTPERYRAKTAVLERHCADVGRDPRSIRHSMMCAFIIGRDQTEIQRRVGALQHVMPVIPRLGTVDAEAVPETVRANGWLVGTPDEVIGQLQALAEAGVERVMLQHFNQTDDEVLELIAKDVMPAMRGS